MLLKVIKKKRKDAGEGEAPLLLTVLGIAIAISIGYFTIHWILSVKEARANYGKKKIETPPPKSPEEMGGYEVTY